MSRTALAVLAALALASSAHAQTDTLTGVWECGEESHPPSSIPYVSSARFSVEHASIHFEASLIAGLWGDPVDLWIGNHSPYDSYWQFGIIANDDHGSHYEIEHSGADSMSVQRDGQTVAVVHLNLTSSFVSVDLPLSAFPAQQLGFLILFSGNIEATPQLCRTPLSFSGSITLPGPTPARLASWGSIKSRWR